MRRRNGKSVKGSRLEVHRDPARPAWTGVSTNVRCDPRCVGEPGRTSSLAGALGCRFGGRCAAESRTCFSARPAATVDSSRVNGRARALRRTAIPLPSRPSGRGGSPNGRRQAAALARPRRGFGMSRAETAVPVVSPGVGRGCPAPPAVASGRWTCRFRNGRSKLPERRRPALRSTPARNPSAGPHRRWR